uniref:Uncharacterized protein n=1 Tax=Plectus sambesii TaxID=2011161 RepID=A0A914VPR4_9BILA
MRLTNDIYKPAITFGNLVDEKIIDIRVPYSVEGNSKNLLKKITLTTHLVDCKMNSNVPVLLDRPKEITAFKSSNGVFTLSVPSSLMKRNCLMMLAVTEISTSQCTKPEDLSAESQISFRIACDTVNDSKSECGKS